MTSMWNTNWKKFHDCPRRVAPTPIPHPYIVMNFVQLYATAEYIVCNECMWKLYFVEVAQNTLRCIHIRNDNIFFFPCAEGY